MSKDQQIFEVAKARGCEPEWVDGDLGPAWYCTCPNNEHGCDRQGRAITLTSVWGANRERQRG